MHKLQKPEVRNFTTRYGGTHIWKGGLAFLAGLADGLVTSETRKYVLRGTALFCIDYNTVPALIQNPLRQLDQNLLPNSMVINFPPFPGGATKRLPALLRLI